MSYAQSKPHLADAFASLETVIGDLRDAVILMDIAAETTVYSRSSKLAELFVRQPLTEGYHVVVMSQDQSDGLDFVMHMVGDLARQLYRDYHAGFHTKPHSNGC